MATGSTQKERPEPVVRPTRSPRRQTGTPIIIGSRSITIGRANLPRPLHPLAPFTTVLGSVAVLMSTVMVSIITIYSARQ